MENKESLKFPNLIIFASSFCLMVLELVAGRIMAPYLGVSLYTWTSVIGIILGGVSIGNYLGGRVADRNLSKKVLSSVFFLAGISSIGVLYSVPFIGNLLGKTEIISIPFATFIFSFFVFFPASLFLGCISPMVVKFDLDNLEKAGQTVGRIYAFSALGSILGTFATGYFLISFFGTKIIVIGVSVVLVLISFLVLLFGKSAKDFLKEKTNVIFGCLLVFSFFIPKNCQEETNYYCINARAQTLDGGINGYVLRLDHLVHSFVYPGNEEVLTYDYEKFYKILTDYRIKQTGENNFEAFFLGGGGYTLPRYFEKKYPESSLEVAEIDPGVTKFNYEHLSLNPETKIKTTNADARMFLAKAPAEKKYDLIFGDAFNDFAVPYHLTTLEFGKIIKEHLSPDGYYAVNVIDNYKYGKFVGSFLKTMREIFPYVYLAPLASNWEIDKRNTFVILAGETELDINDWGEVLWTTLEAEAGTERDSSKEIGYFAENEKVTKFLEEKKAIVLTDNYVPIDNFLAPVFNSMQ